MRVLAHEMAWPEEDVLKLAKSTHERRACKTSHCNSWRSTLNAETVSRIENINAIDMELYQFAQQRFYERFGVDCGRR